MKSAVLEAKNDWLMERDQYIVESISDPIVYQKEEIKRIESFMDLAETNMFNLNEIKRMALNLVTYTSRSLNQLTQNETEKLMSTKETKKACLLIPMKINKEPLEKWRAYTERNEKESLTACPSISVMLILPGKEGQTRTSINYFESLYLRDFLSISLLQSRSSKRLIELINALEKSWIWNRQLTVITKK